MDKPINLRAARSEALLQNAINITSLTAEQKDAVVQKIYDCAYTAGAAPESDLGNIYFEGKKGGLTEHAANTLSRFFEMVADIAVARTNNIKGIVAPVDQTSTLLLDLGKFRSISNNQRIFAEAAFRLSIGSPELEPLKVIAEIEASPGNQR